MSSVISAVPDVFTAREIARAAGVSAREVRALILAAELATVDGRFVAAAEAVRAVRLLRGGPLGGRPRTVQAAGAGETLSRAGLCGLGGAARGPARRTGRVDDDGCGERAGRDPARADAHAAGVSLDAGARRRGRRRRTPAARAAAASENEGPERSAQPRSAAAPDHHASSGSRAKADAAAAGQSGAGPASDRTAACPGACPAAAGGRTRRPGAGGRPRSRGHHRGGPRGIRQPGPRDRRRCGDRTGHGHGRRQRLWHRPRIRWRHGRRTVPRGQRDHGARDSFGK